MYFILRFREHSTRYTYSLFSFKERTARPCAHGVTPYICQICVPSTTIDVRVRLATPSEKEGKKKGKIGKIGKIGKKGKKGLITNERYTPYSCGCLLPEIQYHTQPFAYYYCDLGRGERVPILNCSRARPTSIFFSRGLPRPIPRLYRVLGYSLEHAKLFSYPYW